MQEPQAIEANEAKDQDGALFDGADILAHNLEFMEAYLGIPCCT